MYQSSIPDELLHNLSSASPDEPLRMALQALYTQHTECTYSLDLLLVSEAIPAFAEALRVFVGNLKTPQVSGSPLATHRWLLRHAPLSGSFQTSAPICSRKDIASDVVDAITERVQGRRGTLANARMNEELDTILKTLGLALADGEIDISNAPKLKVVDAEDGSVLIEWYFPDRRLGFNIEANEGQTGWYFAFSRSSGGQCGAGLLASLDMKALLRLMFKKTMRP